MVNIHDLIADIVVLGGASAIGMMLKMAIKPTEAEAKIIARVLVGLGMIIMTLARRWATTHKQDISVILSTIQDLKDKMVKHKVGPQG